MPCHPITSPYTSVVSLGGVLLVPALHLLRCPPIPYLDKQHAQRQ